MEFTSQICTTKEQSERLLALGLKKVTADCVVSSIGSKDRLIHTEEPIYVMESLTSKRIPNYLAWSLHRLIEMCNKAQFGMTISIYNNEVTVDGDLFEVFDNTYDNLISIIEWLIDLNKFNKKYLEE